MQTVRQRWQQAALGAVTTLLVALGTVVPAVSAAGAGPPSTTRTPAIEDGAGALPAGCAQPVAPGLAHCYLAVQPASPPAPVADTTACTVNEQAGYSACNVQSAYGLRTLSKDDGAGSTVAVVDAYDDPNAQADLSVYRAANHLAACNKANGCFKKVNQEGAQSHYPAPDAGWSQEISLDLDMVSAVCPKCHILLVEANSSGLGDLGAAVNEAVALGARAVADSWGNNEFAGETGDDASWDHPGVAITFSSGDAAYQGGVQYPSASPYVTSVGGTELTPSSSSRGWTETAWVSTTSGTPPTQGSGSGCSAYEPKPPWQTDKACTTRMTADVSAVAANVLSYDSYDAGGWYYSFGTSVSSPIVAAIYGLADNPAGSGIPASALYAAPASDFHDIIAGSTGSCTPPSSHKYWCTAVKGYDGPTGRGSPKGIGAFVVPAVPLPTISGVTFSGPASDPEVTVRGSNFGPYPPFPQPAGCGTTGNDYAVIGLNVSDTTAGWEAGEQGDCTGLVLGSWTTTSVTYSFGSGYGVYGTLADGDTYTVEVQDVTASGSVSGLTG